MNILLLGLLGLLILIFFFCLHMEKRNNRVYEFRIAILQESFETYLKLPDYDTMMHYFWIPLNNVKYWTDFKYPRVNNPILAIYKYWKS